jgi:hypothetical protein
MTSWRLLCPAETPSERNATISIATLAVDGVARSQRNAVTASAWLLQA